MYASDKVTQSQDIDQLLTTRVGFNSLLRWVFEMATPIPPPGDGAGGGAPIPPLPLPLPIPGPAGPAGPAGPPGPLGPVPAGDALLA